jgi:hypothetical protein
MGLRISVVIVMLGLLTGCSSTQSLGPIGSIGGASPIVATQDGDEPPVVEEAPPVIGDEAAPTGTDPLDAAPEKNVVLQRNLADKPNATYGDLYRLAVIVMYAAQGDKERAGTALSPRMARSELIRSGLISESWDQGGSNVEHQDAAYVFAKAIGLKGGVMYSVTGARRYAHREMIDRGLFPNENPRQYMSGASVLSAFRDCRESLRATGE